MPERCIWPARVNRIHVIVIQLPPLRQRKDDIPQLANYFLNKYNRETQKDIAGYTPSAIQKLMLHDWPGNVRELENIVYRKQT